MQLVEVTDAMRPGALAAIAKGLSFQEATRVFQLTLVNEAMKGSQGNRRLASNALSMSYQWLVGLLNGTAGKKTSFRRGRRPQAKTAGESVNT